MNNRGSQELIMDYSVEFAHVQADKLDELPSDEQTETCKQLLWVLEEIDRKQESWVTVILVDDYNFELKAIRTMKSTYFQTIKKSGYPIMYVAWESMLNEPAKFLLATLQETKRKNLQRYISKREHIPCSLQIAAWDLIRLGAIPAAEGLLTQFFSRSPIFVARKVINILPQRFEIYENEAKKIIEESIFQNYAPNIVDTYVKSSNKAGNENY